MKVKMNYKDGTNEKFNHVARVEKQGKAFTLVNDDRSLYKVLASEVKKIIVKDEVME